MLYIEHLVWKKACNCSAVALLNFLQNTFNDSTQCAQGMCFVELQYSNVVLIFSDLGQLQNFVTIAIQTASDAPTKDLLIHLRTVGTAYSPLIFDLPSDASCEVLVGRCKGLWQALEETPNLAKLAVSDV